LNLWKVNEDCKKDRNKDTSPHIYIYMQIITFLGLVIFSVHRLKHQGFLYRRDDIKIMTLNTYGRNLFLVNSVCSTYTASVERQR